MSAPTSQSHSPRKDASPADEILIIINEFRLLLQESADYHADQPSLAGVFRESLGILRSLARRLAKSSDRYVVAVVGLTNVGKSTFLNALLGSDLAPRRNGPCTSAVIEFQHGDTLRVSASRRNSIQRINWRCANIAEVHEKLQLVADDAGELAGGDIQKIGVEAPIPILVNGLTIADTPGFGAAQLGTKEGSHETALRTYLAGDVSQVFWVVLAEQGIGKTEKSFHDAFFADVCDDVIVTGCEDWDQSDQLRFKRRFAEKFNKPLLRFHFVSGLQALVARNAGDNEGLATSGIRALEERVTELSDPSGRVEAIEKSLLDLATDLREWISGFRDSRHAKLSVWWRPDSWCRWESSHSTHPIKKLLLEALKP